MNKKKVTFDDSNASKYSVKNKIKKRKLTPHNSKFVKSNVDALKRKVLFNTDDNDDSNAVNVTSSKKKTKRKLTPYHINTKPNAESNSNNVKQRLFSVSMDENDYETNPNIINSTSDLSSKLKYKSPSTSMKVHQIMCPKKEDLVNIDFCDSNSEDSDLFNPALDITSSATCNKINVTKVLINSADCHSQVDGNLNLSEPYLASSENIALGTNQSFEGNYETEDLITSQFNNEPTENDNNNTENEEVFSEEEAMKIDNYKETYINAKNSSTRNYKVFSFKDKNFLILYPGSRIYFSGLISVSILHGEVEVLGYTLTSSSGGQNLYSPRGTSHLHFETKSNINKEYSDDFMDKMKVLLPENELLAFKKLARADGCIMMYQNLEEEKIKFIKRHIPEDIFTQKECVFREGKKGWNVMKFNPKWNKIADSLTSNCKVLLTGGKGVGKSTMLRYLINKLLMKHSAVLIIDLDPGQPEFTPPGCVSIHIINEPVFGPNYTHLRKPLRSVFVPNLNISVSPLSYLNRVEDLYNTRCTEWGYPTIINYVGLTNDNGLDVLSTVIFYTRPTTVIEIRSKNESRNFVHTLSHNLLESSDLYYPFMYFANRRFPKFKIESIPSMSDSINGWYLSSRNIREISLLSYFSEVFSENIIQLEANPEFVYKINISLIQLACNYEECKVNIINQSLVAMCCDNGLCWGWGIVCAIDLEKNELYIQTPIPSKQLRLVTILNKGAVRLPPSFFFASKYSDFPKKYVGEGIIENTGRLPMRSFINLANRGTKL